MPHTWSYSCAVWWWHHKETETPPKAEGREKEAKEDWQCGT